MPGVGAASSPCHQGRAPLRRDRARRLRARASFTLLPATKAGPHCGSAPLVSTVGGPRFSLPPRQGPIAAARSVSGICARVADSPCHQGRAPLRRQLARAGLPTGRHSPCHQGRAPLRLAMPRRAASRAEPSPCHQGRAPLRPPSAGVPPGTASQLLPATKAGPHCGTATVGRDARRYGSDFSLPLRQGPIAAPPDCRSRGAGSRDSPCHQGRAPLRHGHGGPPCGRARTILPATKAGPHCGGYCRPRPR